jgi:hypothetical protein
MKKLLISLCLLAVPAIALAADPWTETFNGIGLGPDKDSACTGARGTAQTASLAACVLKGGTRAGQTFSDCTTTCQPVGPATACNASIVLSVTCAPSAPPPAPPAPGPTPAPTR